jgi:NADH:ubiquinone oxidoreductase subunit H
MSAFFGEVTPELQKAFATAFDISEAELSIAAKMFAEYSGESYPLAA